MKENVGRNGEEAAAGYLAGEGYDILAKNFRVGHGEIDIIATLNKTLVFVEVKTRNSGDYEAEEAITPRKQRQLKKLAAGYLFEKGIDECDCRFDLIAVTSAEGGFEVRHVRDIFS